MLLLSISDLIFHQTTTPNTTARSGKCVGKEDLNLSELITRPQHLTPLQSLANVRERKIIYA